MHITQPDAFSIQKRKTPCATRSLSVPTTLATVPTRESEFRQIGPRLLYRPAHAGKVRATRDGYIGATVRWRRRRNSIDSRFRSDLRTRWSDGDLPTKTQSSRRKCANEPLSLPNRPRNARRRLAQDGRPMASVVRMNRPLPPELLRVIISMRVKPETREALEDLQWRHELPNLGQLLDYIFDNNLLK